MVKEGFLSDQDRLHLQRHINRRKADGLRVRRTNPLRDTNEIRVHIRTMYEQNYSSSGCIKPFHSLGFEYKKPEHLPMLADEDAQKNSSGLERAIFT